MYLGKLQQLRAFAALTVLFGHVLHEANVSGYVEWMEDTINWGFGVDVFFVISGFIIYYITAREVEPKSLVFLARRVLRVVPMYWIFTALMLLAAMVLPGSVNNISWNLSYIFSSFFFFPFPRGDGLFRPILALGWTLNYEMFFYISTSVALGIFRRAPFGILSVIFVVLAASNYFIKSGPLAFWSDPIILEFVFGIIAGGLYLKGFRLPLAAGALLFALGCGMLLWFSAFPTGIRFIDLGGAAIAIFYSWMGAGTSHEGKKHERSLVETLGNSSYAIYLSHPFSINLVALAFSWANLSKSEAFVVVSFVAAVMGGVVAHVLIEKPLLSISAIATRRDLVPR